VHEQAGVKNSLFREEALDHHARGARPGEPLRLNDRWPRRMLPVLLVAVLVIVIGALVVHVPAVGGGSRTVADVLLGKS
jgi:hypothetical protein